MSGRYVSHQSISSADADKPSLPHFSQHLPHELQSFMGLEYRIQSPKPPKLQRPHLVNWINAVSRLTLVIVSLTVLHACTSPGEIIGAQDDTTFVADHSTRLIVRSPEKNAYEVRTLAGEYVRTLVHGQYRLVDVDNRGERFLLRSGVGFVAADSSGALRPLATGSGWRSVALDGSGSRIAMANNHERLIRVLSFDTLELRQEIPCPEDAYCWWVSWDFTDANILWLGGYSHNGYERLDLTTGESTSIPRENYPKIRYPAHTTLSNSNYCRETGATLIRSNNGIMLQEPGLEPRSIVEIKGFRNTFLFGEHFPPISRAAFVADCQYVIFDFHGNDWLVDVKEGLIGRLTGQVWYELPRLSVTP